MGKTVGVLVVGLWLAMSSVAFAGTRIVTVTGTVDDATSTVTVNGVDATIVSGTFSASVMLDEGNNTITAIATDEATNSSSVSIAVDLDTVPPTLVITSPSNGQLFGAQ